VSGGVHADCDACGNLAHASNATCSTQTTCTNAYCTSCDGLTCDRTFANCNGDGLDGCEANLTSDAANCGACGHACASGSCSNGSCRIITTLATNVPAPAGIVVTSSDVWWSAIGYPFQSQTSALQHVPKSGGAVVTALTAPLTGGIAANQDLLTWSAATTSTDGGAPNGNVAIMPLDGGVSNIIANSENPLGGIALGSNDEVSWLDTNGVSGGLREWADGGVRTIAVTTGSTNTTVYPLASIIKSNASTFWIDGDVVSGQTMLHQVFMTDGGLANVGGGTLAIATDGVTIFAVSNPTSGQIRVDAFSAEGNPAQNWIGSAGEHAREVVLGAAADADSFYFSLLYSGEIWQLSRTTGAFNLVAGAQNQPAGMAVDDESIYWANLGDESVGGTIMRAPKN